MIIGTYPPSALARRADANAMHLNDFWVAPLSRRISPIPRRLIGGSICDDSTKNLLVDSDHGNHGRSPETMPKRRLEYTIAYSVFRAEMMSMKPRIVSAFSKISYRAIYFPIFSTPEAGKRSQARHHELLIRSNAVSWSRSVSAVFFRCKHTHFVSYACRRHSRDCPGIWSATT